MRTSLFTKLISFILISCLSMTFEGCTQTKEKRSNLSGDWRFILGDNSKYAAPQFDDSDWEKIRVPGTWSDEGFEHYHGYAWYRKTIEISTDNKDALYLELGKIDDVDEVYLNGHFIGRTGGFPPEYYTAHQYDRKYLLPTEYINNNAKNVIAIRVYDEGGEGGIVNGNIGIYNYGNYTDNSINLFGKWKFRLSDNPKWANQIIDETDWEDVLVPSSWEAQGFENYDGFAWYRKTFKLPEDYKAEDLMIILGKIDDMDEVYINGKLIGQTGDMDKNWGRHDEWDKVRTYNIPDDVLQPGKNNVIAVRVYDQGQAGGIYEGPITLLPRTEYRQFWKRYRGDNFDINIGSITISFN